MAKQHIRKEDFLLNLYKRSWLILVVTIIGVVIMPHGRTLQFEYEIGKPWHYEQLISEYEIPLYKSEEVLKAERDSVLQAFEPYYNFSVEVRERALKKFTAQYSKGIAGLSASYSAYVANRIRQVYLMGIISESTAKLAQQDSTQHIRLVSGNVATSVALHQFFTPMTAYEWLFSDPMLQKQRQALQSCNLNEYLEPNILYDKDRTEVERDDVLSSLPTASGIIQAGQEIVDRGQVINERSYNAIASYLREYNSRSVTTSELFTTYGGQALYIFLIVTMFTLYMLLYRNDYFEDKAHYLLPYLFFLLFPGMISLVMRYHFFTVFIIPLAMAPMFVRIFMDSRTAFMTHVVIVLIASLAVQHQYSFIFVELVGGLAAIFSLRELSKRSQVFGAAFTIALAEGVAYYAVQLLLVSSADEIQLKMCYHFLGCAVLMLLTYPLMFLVEKAFGFCSTVTLVELSDTNKDLLRQLSLVAPGTFQHSITVGNYAAEIASQIGAKSLLVRVGALYHDIGKMRHPVFFTENQKGINPHNRLSSVDSATVIINHVKLGLKMAEDKGLPQVIQDFIRTHHATNKAKFFYVKYQNEHPNEPIDDELFTYPGPNPSTKEQAILMIADTVEAASRSMKEYTEESITLLVNRLVDNLVNEGYFEDCPITFHDVKVAKQTLIRLLQATYHTRIEYPETIVKLKPQEQELQFKPYT